jgi:hypothetical protein
VGMVREASACPGLRWEPKAPVRLVLLACTLNDRETKFVIHDLMVQTKYRTWASLDGASYVRDISD